MSKSRSKNLLRVQNNSNNKSNKINLKTSFVKSANNTETLINPNNAINPVKSHKPSEYSFKEDIIETNPMNQTNTLGYTNTNTIFYDNITNREEYDYNSYTYRNKHYKDTIQDDYIKHEININSYNSYNSYNNSKTNSMNDLKKHPYNNNDNIHKINKQSKEIINNILEDYSSNDKDKANQDSSYNNYITQRNKRNKEDYYRKPNNFDNVIEDSNEMTNSTIVINIPKINDVFTQKQNILSTFSPKQSNNNLQYQNANLNKANSISNCLNDSLYRTNTNNKMNLNVDVVEANKEIRKSSNNVSKHYSRNTLQKISSSDIKIQINDVKYDNNKNNNTNSVNYSSVDIKAFSPYQVNKDSANANYNNKMRIMNSYKTNNSILKEQLANSNISGKSSLNYNDESQVNNYYNGIPYYNKNINKSSKLVKYNSIFNQGNLSSTSVANTQGNLNTENHKESTKRVLQSFNYLFSDNNININTSNNNINKYAVHSKKNSSTLQNQHRKTFSQDAGKNNLIFSPLKNYVVSSNVKKSNQEIVEFANDSNIQELLTGSNINNTVEENKANINWKNNDNNIIINNGKIRKTEKILSLNYNSNGYNKELAKNIYNNYKFLSPEKRSYSKHSINSIHNIYKANSIRKEISLVDYNNLECLDHSNEYNCKSDQNVIRKLTVIGEQ